jgi:hypothetical protein
MTISEEERSMIIQGVIHTVPVIMDKIISRKSPKSAARDALKIDRQSITAINVLEILELTFQKRRKT